jgi:hypothetical protein
MKVMKYNKKANYMFCPDCKNKGDVFCYGTGQVDLPTGFGFLPGETKFSIEKIRLIGFWGECGHCRKKVFNWTNRKRIKRYPKSINNKIRRGV